MALVFETMFKLLVGVFFPTMFGFLFMCTIEINDNYSLSWDALGVVGVVMKCSTIAYCSAEVLLLLQLFHIDFLSPFWLVSLCIILLILTVVWWYCIFFGSDKAYKQKHNSDVPTKAAEVGILIAMFLILAVISLTFMNLLSGILLFINVIGTSAILFSIHENKHGKQQKDNY